MGCLLVLLVLFLLTFSTDHQAICGRPWQRTRTRSRATPAARSTSPTSRAFVLVMNACIHLWLHFLPSSFAQSVGHSYHGFQFVEVNNFPGTLTADNITQVRLSWLVLHYIARRR